MYMHVYVLLKKGNNPLNYVEADQLVRGLKKGKKMIYSFFFDSPLRLNLCALLP